MSHTLSLKLRIWRQHAPESTGAFRDYQLVDVSGDLSLLEALDQLNDQLIAKGERPVHFEHDCREGICGSCGFLVNGQAHGPRQASTVCQLYLRQFRSNSTLCLEPWRANAFPLIQDLVVDRSAFDRLIMAGGTARSTPARRAMGMPCSWAGSRPVPPLKPPPASAAAPAWPVAEMPQPACSWRPSWPTSASCPRASRSEHTGPGRCRSRWRRRASAAAAATWNVKRYAQNRSRPTGSAG